MYINRLNKRNKFMSGNLLYIVYTHTVLISPNAEMTFTVWCSTNILSVPYFPIKNHDCALFPFLKLATQQNFAWYECNVFSVKTVML